MKKEKSENPQKMTFSDYCNSLTNEKEDLLKKIEDETLVSKSTVWKWANGKLIPSKKRRQKISNIVNIPEEILFPNIDSNVE